MGKGMVIAGRLGKCVKHLLNREEDREVEYTYDVDNLEELVVMVSKLGAEKFQDIKRIMVYEEGVTSYVDKRPVVYLAEKLPNTEIWLHLDTEFYNMTKETYPNVQVIPSKNGGYVVG